MATRWDAVAFGAPTALVIYMAMRGGGYDAVVRTEVAIGVWLLVALGLAAGMVPGRWSRQVWTCLCVFGAFLGWTALSFLWTDSAERTMVEATRVSLYLGVLILALAVPARNLARALVGGLACAITAIAAIALLSRLHPDLFAPNVLAEAQPLSRARLAYPLDAWNGLGTFLSMGFPLLLAVTVDARQRVVQIAAAAGLPVLGLATYLTFSRGGALATAAGLALFFVVYQRRWDAFVIGAGALAGTLVLVFVTHHYDALASGLDDAAARSQGDRVLVLTLVVAGLVGAWRAWIDRRWASLPPKLWVSRELVETGIVVVLVAALIGGTLTDLPDKVADSWEEFKGPSIGNIAGAERLSSASGNGRYQLWSEALAAGESSPITGIGAGGYEFWWARHATIPGYVRDAHSLYFETFAELGLVGLALLVGFIVAIIAIGARKALRLAADRAGPFAAAAGGALAFSIALAFDWGWEIAVVPIAFMLLAAAILAPGEEPKPPRARNLRVPRLAAAFGAAAIVFVLVTFDVGTVKVRGSQEAFGEGDIDAAIADAKTAEDVQPYAASPLLQHALVLEQAGGLHDGVALLLEATKKEPTNWRLWLTLSRLQVAVGETKASVASYERALSLNPQSTLIPTGDPRLTHPDRFPKRG